MISLKEHEEACFLWICSFLSNEDRLHIGSTNKELYQLLEPLFNALALYAECQKEMLLFKLRHLHCSHIQQIFGIDSPCQKQHQYRAMVLENATVWKEYNEHELTNTYNPAFILDCSDDKFKVKSICLKLKAKTIEAAIRIAASQKPATVLTEDFEWLCSRVKNINQQSKNGNTALIWAIISENETFFRILLDKGANCKQGNHGGKTPLHFAAISDTDTFVRELLCRKAFMIHDHNGATPLDWAIAKKKTACIKALEAS